MKPSLAETLRRIRPLAPVHKAAHLRGLIASEPRRSIRRVELEAALREVVNRQLGREIREDRRAYS
jgi:hypothetical protein